jgi:hypothetical protein
MKTHIPVPKATYQDVVRLDIGMNDIGLSQQRESEEHLMCVCPHSTHVEPDVLAEPLDHVSQVHTDYQRPFGMNVNG